MTESSNAARYWVLGGRWVGDAKHLPWPRVFGPFADYRSARDTADQLSTPSRPATRYVVVIDVLDAVE